MIDEERLSDAILQAVGLSLGDGAFATRLVLRRLHGGHSGITYLAEFGRSEEAMPAVVKVAPPGLEPVRNRDVLRQAAMIRALADTQIPVPRLLFTSAGNGYVPPFYGTEFVDGDAYEPIFDGPGPCSDDEIRSRALQASALLARIHQLKFDGLEVDPGPAVTPADEVERWQRAFASVPEDLQFGGRALGLALAAKSPDPVEPVLVHGDFRLGNMIAVGGDIKAVLDWEIWSRSDPRIDLAWLVTQADATSHPAARWQPPGMPSVSTLVTTYEEERGIHMGDLAWFSALVRFKVAATSALIVKHNRAQQHPDPTRSRWEPGIAPLVREGLRILEEEL